MHRVGKIFGATLLVAGTTIGAGMLALPVTTGLVGFYPTVVLFFLYWILMTYSAFLFVEVDLWLKDESTNLVSMAKLTLGKSGEVVAWILYLLLLYALTTAYIAASGPFFLDQIAYWFGVEVPPWAGPIPLLVIFSFFVYEGAFYVDIVNRLLMVGLIVTFILLNGWLIPHMNVEQLSHHDLNFLPLAFSIIATSFGYHIIIPTLMRYLHRDLKGILVTIAIGSFIPLVVYIIWEMTTLSVIPIFGDLSVVHGYLEGKDAIFLIAEKLKEGWVVDIAKWFLFFAIVTSFLGVALSLRDFLADGLKIKKTLKGRWSLYFLTFVPPFIFATTNPRAFYLALDYAGTFGVILLLVFLPALMVYVGRYKKGFSSTQFKVRGGAPALIFVMLLSLLLVGVEIANKFNWIQYF